MSLDILVGFGVLTAVIMKNSILWGVTSCSTLQVNRSFGGTCRLHLKVRRVSEARILREAGSKHSSYSSTLKMNATCYSETSVALERITRRYIPEDRNLN
jgi:hypothetical protein